MQAHQACRQGGQAWTKGSGLFLNSVGLLAAIVRDAGVIGGFQKPRGAASLEVRFVDGHAVEQFGPLGCRLPSLFAACAERFDAVLRVTTALRSVKIPSARSAAFGMAAASSRRALMLRGEIAR